MRKALMLWITENERASIKAEADALNMSISDLVRKKLGLRMLMSLPKGRPRGGRRYVRLIECYGEALSMLRRGIPLSTVSSRLNLGYHTVRDICISEGIPLPPRGRPPKAAP